MNIVWVRDKIDFRRVVSKFKLEMSQYRTCLLLFRSLPLLVIQDSGGWDEAKLEPAWNTCKEGFRAILRNAKNYDKSWKYPRNKEPQIRLMSWHRCVRKSWTVRRFTDVTGCQLHLW